MKLIMPNNEFKQSYPSGKVKLKYTPCGLKVYYYLNEERKKLLIKTICLNSSSNSKHTYEALRTDGLDILRTLDPSFNSENQKIVALTRTPITDEEIKYLNEKINLFEKNSRNQIQKAAHLIAQAKRTKTSFLNILPTEIAYMVAASTRDSKIHSMEEAIAISRENFGKPTVKTLP